MDQDITRYLNEHLAASYSAISLIQKLVDTHNGPGARGFFLDLQEAAESDQALLENLLERIGQEPRTLNERTSGMGSHRNRFILARKEIDPENQGHFEALEMLALGVESKRLLWDALREIAVWFHEWDGIDFDALDLRAIRQRDAIEFWRIREGIDSFPDPKRRIEIEKISRTPRLQSPRNTAVLPEAIRERNMKISSQG